MTKNILIACALLVLSSAAVFAQDPVPAATPAPEAAAAAPATPGAPAAAPAAAPVAAPAPFTESLLFTPLEMAAILSAIEGKNVSSSLLNSQNATSIPLKRVISLAGVVYNKPGDWIIWLNGHKLVPGVLLPEIMDISVNRDVVHLQWFDIGMNKIISISLRPHQTYDIVTGLLLPGG